MPQRLKLDEARNALLLVLYEAAHHSDARWQFNVNEIRSLFEPEIGSGFARIVLKSLEDDEYIDIASKKHEFGLGQRNFVSLSAFGTSFIEEKLLDDDNVYDQKFRLAVRFHSDEARGHGVRTFFKISEMPALQDEIPAADRLVTLNHNAPEYSELENEITALKESVLRANKDNHLSDNEEAALSDIDAGLTLWKRTIVRTAALKETLIAGINALVTAVKDEGLKHTAKVLVSKIFTWILGLG